MIFGKPHWKNFYRGIEKEWLLTNGLGSFSSSSIIGANTRRYHGLLVASFRPPVERHLVISKLDESIIINNKEYPIHSNQTPDHIGDGYKYLQKAEINPLPEFTYCVEGVYIEKKVSMVYGKNTVVVVYKVTNSSETVSIRIFPLLNFRDYHSNSHHSNFKFNINSETNGVSVNPAGTDVNIELKVSDGTFMQNNMYFYNMEYAIEKERGLYAIEDHYIPGYFTVDIKPYENKTFTIIGSTDGIDTLDGESIISNEEARLVKLIKDAELKDEFANTLVLAADKFIVHRKSTDAKTIIAGYPWFSDWGRDTMIALPGLTLCTKRYDDAKEIFESFCQYVKNGLIPNMFPDAGQEPIYNTVDASLWFFEAVNKFLEHTNDFDYIKEKVYPKLKEIVDSYKNGTEFNIHMDEDGLIYSGSHDVQLTWMDAKIGEWVVTPRQGKAVEINALWYNALKIMDELSKKFGDKTKLYSELAKKVQESFDKFWNENEQCLYDIIDDSFYDSKIRPNQIIALSLSYPAVNSDKGQKILQKVYEKLYVNFGLRSLAKDDVEYKGIYIGNQYDRDSSYHQGTAWSWLIGPFIGAYLRMNKYSKQSKEFCLKLLEPFETHLMDAGLGSVSEIFDGDEPNLPRGCFAQAWGVGELLRAYLAAKGKVKY